MYHAYQQLIVFYSYDRYYTFTIIAIKNNKIVNVYWQIDQIKD